MLLLFSRHDAAPPFFPAGASVKCWWSGVGGARFVLTTLPLHLRASHTISSTCLPESSTQSTGCIMLTRLLIFWVIAISYPFWYEIYLPLLKHTTGGFGHWQWAVYETRASTGTFQVKIVGSGTVKHVPLNMLLFKWVSFSITNVPNRQL